MTCAAPELLRRVPERAGVVERRGHGRDREPGREQDRDHARELDRFFRVTGGADDNAVGGGDDADPARPPDAGEAYRIAVRASPRRGTGGGRDARPTRIGTSAAATAAAIAWSTSG